MYFCKAPHSKSKPQLPLYRDNVLHARWQIDFCGPFVPCNQKRQKTSLHTCLCWKLQFVACSDSNTHTNSSRYSRETRRTRFQQFWLPGFHPFRHGQVVWGSSTSGSYETVRYQEDSFHSLQPKIQWESENLHRSPKTTSLHISTRKPERLASTLAYNLPNGPQFTTQ